MRLPTVDVAWHRFVAALFLIGGLWLEVLLLVLLFQGNAESSSYRGTTIEGVALFMFMAAGIIVFTLSYFIYRRRNWARVIVILWFAAAVLVTIAVIASKIRA